MTREELATYNGKNRPAYVAVGNIIYDVSSSPLWKDGTHEEVHQAGCDLTKELKTAPHIAAIIERFPAIGRLEEPSTAKSTYGAKLGITTILATALLLAWLLLR